MGGDSDKQQVREKERNSWIQTTSIGEKGQLEGIQVPERISPGTSMNRLAGTDQREDLTQLASEKKLQEGKCSEIKQGPKSVSHTGDKGMRGKAE